VSIRNRDEDARAAGNGGPPAAGRLAVLMRTHREAAGCTQRELAARGGTSLSAVQDLEQGRTTRPRPATLARLAAALRLSDADRDELLASARPADPAGPGSQSEGSQSEGSQSEGSQSEGSQSEGSQSEGSQPEGSQPEGSQPEGSQLQRSQLQRSQPLGGQPLGGRQRPALLLQVLGPLAAGRDGTPVELGPVRQRALLALLVLHAGAGIRRAAIIDAVWGEDPPASAVTMIQTYVSRVRRLLGADPRAGDGGLIAWDGAGYRLDASQVRLDVAEFGDLAERGRRATAAGSPAGACDLFERALALWRGEPLADLEVLRGHPAVVRLGRQRAAVVLEYAAAAADAGSPGRAIAHLEQLTGQEPLDERAHARLMVALAATGRQAAALAVYQDLARRLASELGISPGAELAETHLQILRQDRAAPAASDGAPAAREPAVPRQVPGGLRHFAGRTAELGALSRLAWQAADPEAHGAGGTAVISVISGPAGVGKSALAVRFAHLAAELFPDGQLYVNLRGFDPAGTPVTPAGALRGFLDALQVPVARIPAGLDAQAALFRSLLAGRRMLIVLDNARAASQVRPLLPGWPGCMTLVTSRSPLTGLAVAQDAHPLSLDLLTDAQAHELLARRLGPERVAAEPAAVRELTGFCARLPLALAIVAVHAAARPARALSALADDLRDERSRLDALDAGDPAISPRAVFSWSLQSLSGPARRMFWLLGLHPGPDATPASAASLAGIAPGEARAALRELARASLFTESAAGRFGCHDLLRLYAAEGAREHGSEPDRRAARHRVLDHYLHTARTAGLELFPYYQLTPVPAPQPGVTPEPVAGNGPAMAWFEAEQRVLVAAVTQAAAAGFDVHASQLPSALTVFLERRGQWPDYLLTQQAALAAARRLPDRAAEARAHRSLGHACLQLGSFGDAEDHLGRALHLYRELGDEAGQARAYESLANNCERQGKYRESLGYCERVLELTRAGGRTIRQAMALNNVGWCHAQLGNYDQTLACCRQAIVIYQELGDVSSEAATWDSLGYAFLHLGDYAQAVGCYQKAAQQFSDLGARFLHGSVLAHLGEAHQTAGERDAAIAALTQALAVIGDLDHPEADAARAALERLRSAGPAAAAHPELR
jgi:DNA-binding SARP family transcriptional activator/transcriptional regulator with XRE-family HTH domain